MLQSFHSTLYPMTKSLPPRFLFSLLCLAGAAAHADVSLPAVIGSHMVLQRDQALPVWGWASPGEEVRVALGENKAATKADATGRWRVNLAPMQAGGPFSMTVSGKNTVELTDILVGEVWLGSGQSNMQWTLTQSAGAEQEIAAANHPQIRLFSVPLVPSGTPALDVVSSWKECSPQTAPAFSAVLYFYGREIQQHLNVPVGLINSSWGGTLIQPWTPPEGFASQPELKAEQELISQQRNAYQQNLLRNVLPLKNWLELAEKNTAAGQEVPDPPMFPNHPLNSNSAPTGLYNGMIHPLVPFAIRGAIWYQGESNNGQGMRYHAMMKGLIQGWRSVWNQGDFPFYFVQLAPYRYGVKDTSLPEIWEAQTATLSVPNTGMAVINDIGNPTDIHPRNKLDVGKRLALWAKAKTYGAKNITYSGPLYDSMTVELDQIEIKFKYAENGLLSRDGKPLTMFTIAGEDRKFVPAVATISKNAVIVKAASVENPVAVRFAWSQTAEPNLTNKEGLPASAFRTDRWGAEEQPVFRNLK